VSEAAGDGLGSEGADRQGEGTGLAIGDHQPDLPDPCRVERRCIGNGAAAKAGPEFAQWQVDRGPCRWRDEGGLVAHPVEGFVGAQIELVALAVTAHLEQVGRCTRGAKREQRRSYRGEAPVMLQRNDS